MKTIEHAIDIQAPPATVWQALTDTDRYADWNPFMPRLSGRLAAGERLTLTVRPGTRTMTFRPTVLAVERGSLIRWLDANHREVSPTSAEYIDAEQRMRSLGTRLMDAVRSADGVIAF